LPANKREKTRKKEIRENFLYYFGLVLFSRPFAPTLDKMKKSEVHFRLHFFLLVFLSNYSSLNVTVLVSGLTVKRTSLEILVIPVGSGGSPVPPVVFDESLAFGEPFGNDCLTAML
jgi:hypothetical protein